MIRIKDPKVSLPFYTNVLGMKLVLERHFAPDAGDFSLYFLATPSHLHALPPSKPDDFDVSKAYVNGLWQPVIELTHNHGTESNDTFRYYNGNEPPFGFSHLGFRCSNVAQVTSQISTDKVVQRLSDTQVIVADPDNYHILLEASK